MITTMSQQLELARRRLAEWEAKARASRDEELRQEALVWVDYYARRIAELEAEESR